ncbi:MAG: N-acetylglucosamine-6-phosphate deacetylase [Phormidesmis sp.]
MPNRTLVLNARLPFRIGLFQIVLQGETVRAIEPMAAAASDLAAVGRVIDVAGDWISLGAVDLQINGALGLAFPDLRPAHFEQFHSICELLWQQGVDGFCPTLVTTSPQNFQGSLAAIQAFQPQQGVNCAKILGVHLEGPFLNPAKRGAHPAAFLQPLTLENVKAVIGDYAQTVRIVTLAPEMTEDANIIEWLCGQNITVSLGHSLADKQQASRAIAAGATMLTHAFNAMPGLHHRQPGLLSASLSDSRVFCGFIADGQHICPTMLDLLLRIGRGSADTFAGGLFLVSDALSPLGLADGTYPWDDREIEVVSGTARLADGTLAGTTLPLIAGAQNLVKWELCNAEEAIALVTQFPRQAIGLPLLGPGSPANLLRWQHQANTLTWQRL